MQNYEWIGERTGSNFSYTKGEKPFYSEYCKNSLIISDLKKGFVKGIDNHALINFENSNYIIPIKEVDEILRLSINLLKDKKIFYKKPFSIHKRENLEYLTPKEIKQSILENYGFEIKNIFEIKTKKGKHRVYKVVSNKDQFILKYVGQRSVSFESQKNLSNKLTYFPQTFQTFEGNKFFLIKNNFYGLEEFIEGEKNPKTIENYFLLLGKHTALMHNEINSKSNKTLEKNLLQEDLFFTESNILSNILDFNSFSGNNLFTNILKDYLDMYKKNSNDFALQIIHGDLNKSNLLWNKDIPKMIDSENIAFSKRLKEFIPALLFEGNLKYPKYNSRSLIKFLINYNLNSNLHLNESETHFLPLILKNSLIKLYDIYCIRRNFESKDFKKNIYESIKLIDEEKCLLKYLSK